MRPAFQQVGCGLSAMRRLLAQLLFWAGAAGAAAENRSERSGPVDAHAHGAAETNAFIDSWLVDQPHLQHLMTDQHEFHKDDWAKFHTRHKKNVSDTQRQSQLDEQLSNMLSPTSTRRLQQFADGGKGDGRFSQANLDDGQHGLTARLAETSRQDLASVFQDTICTDALATNYGDHVCSYDCDALREAYFPGRAAWQESDRSGVRCFLYNAEEQQWRAENGPDLMDLKQNRFDWFSHTGQVPRDLVGGSGGSVDFLVGEPDACTNVTVVTETVGSGTGSADNLEGMNSTVTRCLPSGIHEHAHTVSAGHTVTVVGYNESNVVHSGSGGVTSFVVGECTDVLIRVETTATATSGGSMTLVLAAARMPLNQPDWVLQVPAGSGTHEIEFCMFDNDYTLSTVTSGWQGTVAVVSYAEDSTIYIPEDEDWIIQGTIVDGRPVKLDSRLSSGSGNGEDATVSPEVRGCRWGTPSSANLVFRHFRISGQVAPLDKFQACRSFSLRTYSGDPSSRHGGAFKYEGGAVPVRLILVRSQPTSSCCFNGNAWGFHRRKGWSSTTT